jgi:transcription elongation factor Elf1
MQVKATNEHHWYCPFCGRSCLRPIVQVGSKVWHVTCSSCGEKYSVVSEELPTSENVGWVDAPILIPG